MPSRDCALLVYGVLACIIGLFQCNVGAIVTCKVAYLLASLETFFANVSTCLSTSGGDDDDNGPRWGSIICSPRR